MNNNDCVCSNIRNTVKEEYDAWLRLPEIRSVDVMASLDPLERWKMHITQFQSLLESIRLFLAASSAPLEKMFSRAKLIHAGASAMEPTSPTAGGISSPKS